MNSSELIEVMFPSWDEATVEQTGETIHVYLSVNARRLWNQHRALRKGDVIELLGERTAAVRSFVNRPRGIRFRPGRRRVRL